MSTLMTLHAPEFSPSARTSPAPLGCASNPRVPRADHEAISRRLKVVLLRDLVSQGLYRVPTDALAERLLPLFR